MTTATMAPPAWLQRVLERQQRIAAAVQFDAERHIYRHAGRQLAGVTSVPAAIGLVDDRGYTPEHAERGTYLHKATLLIDDADLLHDAVPNEWRGYTHSYTAWCDVVRPRWLLREAIVADLDLDVGGTIDRFGFIFDVPCVVDFKFGQRARWHGLQLAGYKRALVGPQPDGMMAQRAIQRRALYLFADGRQGALVPYDDRRDESFFLAALTCCKFQQEYRS